MPPIYVFNIIGIFSNKLITPFPIQKQGISTLLFFIYSQFLPPLHLPPLPPTMLCAPSPLHTLMQLLQSRVPLCLHLLQSKAYTRSQRYLPPNSDYESDNSIFFVSSGISTSFSCLSFFFNTMRLILRLDLFSFFIKYLGFEKADYKFYAIYFEKIWSSALTKYVNAVDHAKIEVNCVDL